MIVDHQILFAVGLWLQAVNFNGIGPVRCSSHFFSSFFCLNFARENSQRLFQRPIFPRNVRERKDNAIGAEQEYQKEDKKK
jgi:hypothetical protein